MGGRLSRSSSLEGESPSAEDLAPSPAGKRLQLASLLVGSEKLSRVLKRGSPPPYVRRVGWIREIQTLLRAHKQEHAVPILRLLRKDLGLEGTFLNDILYKHATFLNLVDPISHDLLMSLARDLQCPKKEYDPLKSTDRICRQLIYHLTPHSKWQRHNMPRRKCQACLKTILQKKSCNDTVDLSGIPLSVRDIQRVAYYLQSNGDSLTTVDLSFTELTDETLSLLVPFLGSLPQLTHLALNGNRLTRATVKELTDVMKDANRFQSLAWIDLGNNVNVFSMPQPLLVRLRRRLCQQTMLPIIHETLDAELSGREQIQFQEEGEGEGEGEGGQDLLPGTADWSTPSASALQGYQR
uniref:Leucine-rich repeat-containing protein 75B n=1 Tax=Geotrypetes seraphini TaxID=260995 RepID=A0A6P8S556_GEOSA|nr:leucine-rich repeat-containing protein 75B [Geotrypetes seraphini]